MLSNQIFTNDACLKIFSELKTNLKPFMVDLPETLQSSQNNCGWNDKKLPRQLKPCSESCTGCPGSSVVAESARQGTECRASPREDQFPYQAEINTHRSP